MKQSIPSKIVDELEVLLGKSTSTTPLAKGGNSSVWSYSIGNKSFAVKLYPIEDGSHRIEIEFAALTWLRESGFLKVPGVIHQNIRQKFAVYELLSGKKVPEGAVADDHIRQYFDLFLMLKQLSRADTKPQFGSAKEACFNTSSHMELIDNRLAALNKTPWNNVTACCNERLLPLWKIVKEKFQNHHNNHVVTKNERILSPSDVGFHNALLDESDQVHFFDFEYFGWDDPIKFLADFTLQPQYDLSAAQLIPHLQLLLADETDGKLRYLKMLQLLNVKWALILLNPALITPRQASNEDELAQLLDERLRRVEQRLRRFDTIFKPLELGL